MLRNAHFSPEIYKSNPSQTQESYTKSLYWEFFSPWSSRIEEALPESIGGLSLLLPLRKAEVTEGVILSIYAGNPLVPI